MSIKQQQGTGSSAAGINVEYTEGDTDATITGIAMLAEGVSNDLQALQVDASKHLQIDIAASSATVTVDGSGVTQPVSGTVTANLSATDNAVLDAIQAAVETIDNVVSGSEAQVDVVTSALPTGAATETTLDSVKTAVEIIDNAISGSEMQVDVVAALPAGTNAIGKLAANSGVDIGDVDVTSLPSPISGPGNPTIDSYSHVAINLTTGANQVLVSSAASKQIWVYGYALTCGDADGQTVALQDEDDTAITGVMEFPQYGGISAPPSGNFAMPLFKLATDKDLEIDITSGDVDGWLCYAIVSV